MMGSPLEMFDLFGIIQHATRSWSVSIGITARELRDIANARKAEQSRQRRAKLGSPHLSFPRVWTASGARCRAERAGESASCVKNLCLAREESRIICRWKA